MSVRVRVCLCVLMAVRVLKLVPVHVGEGKGCGVLEKSAAMRNPRTSPPYALRMVGGVHEIDRLGMRREGGREGGIRRS